MKPPTRRRAGVALTATALSVSLASCISYSLPDQYAFQVNQKYLEEKLCTGLMELEFGYGNGDGTVSYTDYVDADGNRFYSYDDALDHERRQRETRHAEQLRKIREEGENMRRLAGENPELAGKLAMDIIAGMRDVERTPLSESVIMLGERFKEEKHSARSELTRFAMKTPQPRYIPQRKPENCWAASLSTAFAYLGVEHEQEKFIEALRAQCANRQRGAATVNQMLWAAYRVHAQGDRWLARYDNNTFYYVSKDGLRKLANAVGLPYFEYSQTSGVAPQIPMPAQLQQVQMPRIFSLEQTELGWTTTYSNGQPQTSGGLFLLDKTADIVLALSRGYPVVVGFKDGKGGHTGVITQMTTRPGGQLDKKTNTVYLDYRTRVNTVEYIDPRLGEGNIVMDGDTFLRELAFAIAVKS